MATWKHRKTREETDDLVAVDDGFDAVGDDEQRRVAEAPPHRTLHDLVGVVIHGCRGLVHHHHLPRPAHVMRTSIVCTHAL